MVGSVLRVRYELTQLLNEGPIFATYAARDRLQGRELCVRLIRKPFADEPEFIAKIREVVKQQLGIAHPGVESMLEVDEDEGAPFLISELTKGLPLAERIRKLAPFSVPVAVSTAISLCEGLDALHAAGLAHGDVSAQNVASLPDGQVTLQIPGMWQAYAVTPVAAAIALPSMSPYLSPEVSAGAMPSAASDVYAAGVLLYELLTGRLPYNADTPVSMALKHATGTVPSVRMYNPSVPAVLDEIVKKALAKEPSMRYANAGALLSDLRVLQDALRFGRTVTWPISQDLTPLDNMPKTTAPRVSASAETKTKPTREPSDVPMFLWVGIAFFGAVVATMVGIWLWFNLSKPVQVKVPNLLNLTVAEAQDMVKPSKLDIVVDSTRTSEKVEANHIISTDPAAGDRVRQGGHIRVVLSAGSGMVQVPDLKGNSLDQVRSILSTVNLELDENVQMQHSRTVERDKVISQTPKAGKKVDQTTRVRVVLSSGPPDGGDNPGDEESGPLVDTNLYTLRVKLSGIDKAVTLRVDLIDDTGTRTLMEEQHDPEDSVELMARGVGKKVTFKIYYDNELVKTVDQTVDDAAPLPTTTGGGDEQ